MTFESAANHFETMGLVAITALALALAVAAGFAAPLPIGVIVAAVCGAAGLAALHTRVTGVAPRLIDSAIDGLVIGLLAAMRDDTAPVWQIPAHWIDVLHLTDAGFGVACLIYFLGAINVELRIRRICPGAKAWRFFSPPSCSI